MSSIPSFLENYATQYKEDPRQACRQWLRDAKYGMFIHYGLYSLLGRHEWVQYREKIRVADYATLQQYFLADAFDAEAIADLAVRAEMKYICLTTRHHDSFCLWDTAQTTFNSVVAPCGRDLVWALAEACEERALGLCLYYSHGRDWRHPHAPNNDKYGPTARPQYDPPEAAYAVTPAHNLRIYLDFVREQLTELLTQYGPVASIWLDGIGTPRAGDWQAFRCQELYDHLRVLQPQVLVAYKDGLTGTEDYLAPEMNWDFEPPDREDRPWELCGHLGGGWGYTAGMPGRSPEEVWTMLRQSVGKGGNLLLNTGPLPDGAIDLGDEKTLLEVGRRIRHEGFPHPG